MTPQPKSTWKRLREQRTVPWPVVLLGSLIPIAAAGAAVLRSVNTTMASLATKAGVESTYVRRDTFALTHQRDSLNSTAELRAIKTNLDALVRACQRRKECP